MENKLSQYLNQTVSVKMDRPLGSLHPKHNFKYEVNYGYVPDTTRWVEMVKRLMLMFWELMSRSKISPASA